MYYLFRAIQDGLTSSNNVGDGEADQPPRSQVQVAQLPVPSMEQSLGRGWALAVLAFSILGIIVSVWMLVYVNIKLCDGTLAGKLPWCFPSKFLSNTKNPQPPGFKKNLSFFPYLTSLRGLNTARLPSA